MKLVNSTVGRLLIAAVCIAAAQAAIWRLNHLTALAAAQAETFEVAALPLQLKEWSGEDVELDPRLLEATGALKIVNRSYVNAAGRRAAVHVAMFKAAGATPHSPEICYTNGGWSTLKKDWQRDSHDRRYCLMIVEQSGARVAVAFWYQLGPHVVSSPDEGRKVLQRLRWQGQRFPPLVKVMMHIPIEFSDDDAKTAAEELGAGIFDWIKSSS